MLGRAIGRALSQEGRFRRGTSSSKGETRIPFPESNSFLPGALIRGLHLLAAVSLGLFATPAFAAAPSFAAEEALTSEAGNALLEWTGDGEIILEIAEGPHFADARELYRGTNRSMFVSGLEDGAYVFRLRDDDGRVSQTLALTVRHQSLGRALLLAAVGALVFLAVVAVILRGVRDE